MSSEQAPTHADIDWWAAANERLKAELEWARAALTANAEVEQEWQERAQNAEASLEQARAEPQPGVLHPVDQAFYDLTVKQRDDAWRTLEAREAALEQARQALRKAHRYLTDEAYDDKSARIAARMAVESPHLWIAAAAAGGTGE